uniref:Uncharacterized protein n=1 Tax=Panagrolaimus sp. JU765 TaxID=591449 RepID=A0AC34PZQ0_9BILA
MRTVDLAISVERLFATYYSETYSQKKSFKFLGPILLLICMILGLQVGYFSGNFEYSYIIKFSYGFVLDTTNILMIYMLRKKNKQLRILSNCSHVSLSKKYQLVENIRILVLFRGQSIITLFYGLTTNLFGIIRFVLNQPNLSSATISMWFNIYVITLSIYWTKKSCILSKLSTKLKKNQKIEPYKILDTFGGQIQINQTIEEHFNALKFAWK